mmetsp:Transcript_25066/g.57107  ORF Transcript_25066/g.57107 Transcript_25066/m.57107 type:complete len:209 (-) Transcript_25066:818-1444(-)
MRSVLRARRTPAQHLCSIVEHCSTALIRCSRQKERFRSPTFSSLSNRSDSASPTLATVFAENDMLLLFFRFLLLCSLAGALLSPSPSDPLAAETDGTSHDKLRSRRTCFHSRTVSSPPKARGEFRREPGDGALPTSASAHAKRDILACFCRVPLFSQLSPFSAVGDSDPPTPATAHAKRDMVACFCRVLLLSLVSPSLWSDAASFAVR